MIKSESMKRLLVSLAVVVMASMVPLVLSAAPECEAGLGFYGTDGILDDCLQGAGSDCLYCTEIIVVGG